MAVKDVIIHLRFGGESREATAGEIGISNLDDDDALLRAVADHFDLSLEELKRECVIERSEGAIIIRPKAIFG